MAKQYPGSESQKPQFEEDKHAPGYDNDTPDNWLRGGGQNGACGKPGFDSGPSGKKG